MSTDPALKHTRHSGGFAKSRLVLVTARIGFFPFAVFFPLRCLGEVIEGFSDILCLFKRQRVYEVVAMLENIHAQIRESGPLDLADIDVKSSNMRVNVRLLMR